MRPGLIVLILCLPGTSLAQIAMSGARAAALAGAAVALGDDRWGESNPGSWAHAERASFSLHAAQLYGLPELRHGAALLVLPLGTGAAAFSAGTFGFDLYRASSWTVGYAVPVRPHTHRPVFVGVRLRWHFIRIARHGSASAPTLSAGIVLPAEPGISLGASAVNVLTAPGPLRREMPRSVAVGASYAVARNLHVSMEFAKEVRRPGEFRVGTEVRPVDALVFRAGFTTDPPRAAGGVGLQLGALTTDVAVERHLTLGWSPSLSLHVRW